MTSLIEHTFLFVHRTLVTRRYALKRSSVHRNGAIRRICGAEGALQQFGYLSFRSNQQELAIKNFVQGDDVFVCLPTGSGKSLCYCILPAVFDALRGTDASIVVVVSPLIALMKDQVRAMSDKGARAVFVGDCLEDGDIASVCEEPTRLHISVQRHYWRMNNGGICY